MSGWTLRLLSLPCGYVVLRGMGTDEGIREYGAYVEAVLELTLSLGSFLSLAAGDAIPLEAQTSALPYVACVPRGACKRLAAEECAG